MSRQSLQKKGLTLVMAVVMTAALPGVLTEGAPVLGPPIPANYQHTGSATSTETARKSARNRKAPKRFREVEQDNGDSHKRVHRQDPSKNVKAKSGKARSKKAERKVGDPNPDLDGSTWLGQRWSCIHNKQKNTIRHSLSDVAYSVFIGPRV